MDRCLNIMPFFHVHGLMAALLAPLAQRTRPDQILRALERCLETETHLDRYVQVGLVLEALLDALAQILEASAHGQPSLRLAGTS